MEQWPDVLGGCGKLLGNGPSRAGGIVGGDARFARDGVARSRLATVEQVADVSFSGGVMPQKSTDFFPKLLSGLTVYKLD